MKRSLLLMAAALLFVGAGCVANNTTETTSVSDTSPVITTTNPETTTTTTEDNGDGLKTQTFQSENGDFSYTLNWNTKGLELSETKNEWSSENAPSFDIVGGGTISVMTDLIDVPGYTMDKFIKDYYFDGKGDWPDSEPKPSSAGTTNSIYYFTDTPDADNRCLVQYAVIKGKNEALGIRMEDCEGNDMKAGEAFSDLYSDVVITRK